MSCRMSTLKETTSRSQNTGIVITFGEAKTSQGTPRVVRWRGRDQGPKAEEEVRTVTITEGPPAHKRARSPSQSARTDQTEPSSKIRGCPISDQCRGVSHVHRHVISAHLPFFAQPETACWGCYTQCVRNATVKKHLEECPKARRFDEGSLDLWVRLSAGLLNEIAEQAGRRRKHLCQLVCEMGISPRGCVVPPLRAALLDHYDRSMGTQQGSTRTIDPPSSEGCLLHWRLLAALAAACSPTGRTKIRRCSMPIGPIPRVLPRGTDAHCHLRESTRRNRGIVQGRQWQDDFASLTVVNIECYPGDWGKGPVTAPGLRVLNAVGLHPTSVPAEAEEANRRIEGAKQAIRRGAAAVGEIGIDLYHRDSEDVALMQQATLANLSVYAASKGLPIVLHVRDQGNNCKAGAMCREVLQQSVPRSQKIQLHCFDSGLAEHHRWKAAFPETMLSISGKLLKADRHPELDRVVQEMGLEELLIETDSPHLCPRGIPSRLHGPTSIRLVADRIGELRSLPPSIVLEVASKNAQTFFGF